MGWKELFLHRRCLHYFISRFAKETENYAIKCNKMKLQIESRKLNVFIIRNSNMKDNSETACIAINFAFPSQNSETKRRFLKWKMFS